MQALETYNIIDLFIVGTLFITLVLGIWKGFVRSLTALAGLVLGIVLAAKYYTVVEPYLNKISSLDRTVSMILSMIIVFLGVQVLFVVIRRILDAILHITHLSWLDRIFGAAMGFAGGFLIIASTVQVLLLGLPDWPLVKNSKLVKPVDQLTAQALKYAPKQVSDQVQNLLNKIKGLSESAPAGGKRPELTPPKSLELSPGPVR